MRKHIHLPAALAGIALCVAGCASAPSRFYTLNSTAKGDGSPALPCSVLVGPVTVPALVDHPQFTVQVGPNRVEQDEFNRWAVPLNDNIARVVADDLSALLGTKEVTTSTMANFKPNFQVTINVQRFNSLPGKSAEIDAFWMIQKLSPSATFSGHTVAVEPLTGNDYEALAAAHSRGLAKVSSDIASKIRAEAGGKP